MTKKTNVIATLIALLLIPSLTIQPGLAQSLSIKTASSLPSEIMPRIQQEALEAPVFDVVNHAFDPVHAASLLHSFRALRSDAVEQELAMRLQAIVRELQDPLLNHLLTIPSLVRKYFGTDLLADYIYFEQEGWTFNGRVETAQSALTRYIEAVRDIEGGIVPDLSVEDLLQFRTIFLATFGGRKWVKKIKHKVEVMVDSIVPDISLLELCWYKPVSWVVDEKNLIRRIFAVLFAGSHTFLVYKDLKNYQSRAWYRAEGVFRNESKHLEILTPYSPTATRLPLFIEDRLEHDFFQNNGIVYFRTHHSEARIIEQIQGSGFWVRPELGYQHARLPRGKKDIPKAWETLGPADMDRYRNVPPETKTQNFPSLEQIVQRVRADRRSENFEDVFAIEDASKHVDLIVGAIYGVMWILSALLWSIREWHVFPRMTDFDWPAFRKSITASAQRWTVRMEEFLFRGLGPLVAGAWVGNHFSSPVAILPSGLATAAFLLWASPWIFAFAHWGPTFTSGFRTRVRIGAVLRNLWLSGNGSEAIVLHDLNNKLYRLGNVHELLEKLTLEEKKLYDKYNILQGAIGHVLLQANYIELVSESVISSKPVINIRELESSILRTQRQITSLLRQALAPLESENISVSHVRNLFIPYEKSIFNFIRILKEQHLRRAVLLNDSLLYFVLRKLDTPDSALCEELNSLLLQILQTMNIPLPQGRRLWEIHHLYVGLGEMTIDLAAGQFVAEWVGHVVVAEEAEYVNKMLDPGLKDTQVRSHASLGLEFAKARSTLWAEIQTKGAVTQRFQTAKHAA